MPANTLNPHLYLIVILCTIVTACGGGGGAESGTPNTVPAPAAPTNLTSVGSFGEIEISWTASSTATSYNVYWSTAPGVTPQNGNQIAADQPPVTITGLDDGTNYYIIVTARNSGGESAPSDEVLGTTSVVLPAKVTGVRALPGDGDATVEWSPQSDADSYTLFARNFAEPGDSEFQNVTSPYTVTNLNNGDTYEFSVAASNSNGQGSSSQPVTATPTAPVPGWTEQIVINTPFSIQGAQVSLEDVAINDNGVAAVVWSSGDLREFVINHTATGDWGNQFSVDAWGATAAVDVTTSNDIVVVYDVNAQSLWMRRYRMGSWSDPQRLATTASNIGVSQIRLASDLQGNLFATWVEERLEQGRQPQESVFQVWANRYDAGIEDWGDATMLVESVARVRHVSIDSAATNRAVVAWSQDTMPYDIAALDGGPRQRVVAASIFDGLSWAPGSVVGHNDLVNLDTAKEISVDINDSGAAAILWIQTRASTQNDEFNYVDVVRLDPVSGQWSSPETIDVAEGSWGFSPKIIVYASGNIRANWRFRTNSFISSATFDQTSRIWSAVEQLPTSERERSGTYAIDDNNSQSTTLVWTEDSPTAPALRIRRLTPGMSNWSDASLLGGRVGPEMLFSQSRNGHEIAVTKSRVIQLEEFYDFVFASLYSPTP